MPALIERVRPPLGLRGLQATDLIDWDRSDDAAAIRQLISDITAMMQAHGTPRTQPEPISAGVTASPKPRLRLPAAKPPPTRLVWAGAMVVAAATTLALVLRHQPAPPANTKPSPPAAAIFIPASLSPVLALIACTPVQPRAQLPQHRRPFRPPARRQPRRFRR